MSGGPGIAISEADHQAQVLELAGLMGRRSMHVRKAMGSRKHGWVTPTSVSGWPDAVLWHPKQKRLIFIEFKTDKGRLTPGQRDVIGSLLTAGQEVYVSRPSGFDAIRSVLAECPAHPEEDRAASTTDSGPGVAG
jgi:hypothetical protein